MVIYAFRNDLLDPEFDISSKLDENRGEYVANVLAHAEILDGMPTEDYNYEAIIAKIREDLNLIITEEDIKAESFDQCEEKLLNIVKTVYADKMSAAAPDQRSEIERILYLQILDNAWREHLYSMDTLKTGIGLRGYNQKDPLVEYKKESYNMFIELISSIKFEVIKILFTVQLRDESAENKDKEVLDQMVSNMEEGNDRLSTNHDEHMPGM